LYNYIYIYSVGFCAEICKNEADIYAKTELEQLVHIRSTSSGLFCESLST